MAVLVNQGDPQDKGVFNLKLDWVLTADIKLISVFSHESTFLQHPKRICMLASVRTYQGRAVIDYVLSRSVLQSQLSSTPAAKPSLGSLYIGRTPPRISSVLLPQQTRRKMSSRKGCFVLFSLLSLSIQGLYIFDDLRILDRDKSEKG